MRREPKERRPKLAAALCTSRLFLFKVANNKQLRSRISYINTHRHETIKLTQPNLTEYDLELQIFRIK